MDPVSAGASIIAFITLSLKTAKTIHQALSSIKDAPKSIAELTQDVKAVSVILDRLSQCSFVGSSQTTVAALRSQVASCERELSSISSRIQSYDTSSSGRSARLWKNIRAAWKERELDQTRNRIRDHSAQLGVYLSLIQIETSSNTASAVTEHTSNTKDTLQSILQGISEINKRLDVEDNRPLENDANVNSTAPASGIVEDEVTGACNDLEDSVSRLSALAHEKGSLLEAEDAEQIIHDLQRLIQTARDQAGARSPNTPTSNSNKKTWETDQALRLVSSLILSAPILAINKPARGSKRKAAVDFDRARIETENCQDNIQTSSGTLTLHAKKRRRYFQHNGSEADPSETVNSQREVVATITFRPTAFSSSISISVTQDQLFDRSVHTIPRIAIIPIIPIESYVFKVVLLGHVEELRRLLAEGKCSIRDHSETGMGLLHYANHSDMCKFLLEAGADPNDISPGYNALKIYLGPSRINLEEFEMCEILLQAGADPLARQSSGEDIWHITPIFHAALHTNIGSLKPFAKHNPLFSHEINIPDRFGYTLLHTFIQTFFPSTPYRRWAEVVSLLLDVGADVHARSDNRETCLHILFLALGRRHLEPDRIPHIQNVLILLVRQGADVNAVTGGGMSVTYIAYTRSYRCSIFGDLWDSVLAICGYDILPLGRIYPRKPGYRALYTRAHFENLWKGNEHLCPYWNDDLWPDPCERVDELNLARLNHTRIRMAGMDSENLASEGSVERMNVPLQRLCCLEDGRWTISDRLMDLGNEAGNTNPSGDGVRSLVEAISAVPMPDNRHSPERGHEIKGSTTLEAENKTPGAFTRQVVNYEDTGSGWVDTRSELVVEQEQEEKVWEEDLLKNPWTE